APAPAPAPAAPAPAPAAPAPAAPAVTTSPAPPPELAPAGAQSGPPPVTAPTASPITTQPDLYAAGRSDRQPRRSLPLAGVVGGGAMALVGAVLWGTAKSMQKEIDDAPVNSKEQLVALQDLETRGDGYARVGNAFVIGGLVVSSISTFYLFKRDRGRARSAHLVPVPLAGGGGIALSFGGTP
ncbi:MAG TPA: hypothetical protein VNO30_41325, partial [Kofleriaceae bacterium]|nr:hypothetical protein [Kofleriaceae bacterium]